MSPHIKYDGVLEYGKFLLVESGIPGCGIRYSTQGIRNPGSLTIGIRNSTSATERNPESSKWYAESTAWKSNPEFQERLGWPDMGREMIVRHMGREMIVRHMVREMIVRHMGWEMIVRHMGWEMFVRHFRNEKATGAEMGSQLILGSLLGTCSTAIGQFYPCP